MIRKLALWAAIAAVITWLGLLPAKTADVAAPRPVPIPIVKALIWFESRGKNPGCVKDSNGLPSCGILQFQEETWRRFSRESGLAGSPLSDDDSIRMANWAVSAGHGGEWSTYDQAEAKALTSEF